MSFLPESDVKRIIDYAISHGKRSFAALMPDNAYGAVVEAAFQQDVARRNAPRDRAGKISARSGQAHRAGAAAWRRRRRRADAIFIPDGADAVPQVVAALAADHVNFRRVQLLGTGLWDDPRIFSTPALHGGLFAAPEFDRLPQFLGALPLALRAGPGAHRDTSL